MKRKKITLYFFQYHYIHTFNCRIMKLNINIRNVYMKVKTKGIDMIFLQILVLTI